MTILMVLFSACKKEKVTECDEHTVTACSEDPAKTNIRIRNNSDYNFCNLVLDPYFQKVNCGIITKSTYTCYRSFDKAYSYAYIQFYVGEKEFTFQPIDYVGETELGPGNFTYAISITDFEKGQISLVLE
jgi:hypothetical protein